MPFRTLDISQLITLDDDGKLRSIRPLAANELDGYDPSDPAQVAKLSRIFTAYTGKSPIDAREATAKWLTRWNIMRDDPRFDREFDRLISEGASNRAVLAEARRAGERSELLTATGGNLGVNAIYVNEGDDPCEECLVLGGEEMTLQEFENNGMMPGDRCLGGDNCKCILIPIERR